MLLLVCYSGFDFNSTFGEMKFREEEGVLEIWNWEIFLCSLPFVSLISVMCYAVPLLAGKR